MADRPILEPVRFGNGSYCILKDKTLIIGIQNSSLDCDKETTTQIEFPGYGIHSRPTKPLRCGKSVILTFAWPSDDFFNVDRVFYVTVDVDNVLGEDPTTRHNTTRVVCKAMNPYLVVIPDEKGELVTQADKQLKFIVQNQGTAYARPTKTRVNLVDIGVYDVPTDGLEPGYSTNVLVKIEQIAYAKGKLSKGAPLKYKISLDIDDNIKLAPRIHEGSITMDKP